MSDDENDKTDWPEAAARILRRRRGEDTEQDREYVRKLVGFDLYGPRDAGEQDD